MEIKEQLSKIKKNWLIIVLVLVAFLLFSEGGGIVSNSLDSMKSAGQSFGGGYDEMSSDRADYPVSNDGNFAPEIEDRKIIKSSSLSTEIKRGEFLYSEERLKNVIISSGAFLLNERVNRNGEGWKSYYSGYYQLKVDTEKYNSVVTQLKEIGEVQSFNENMADVTGNYDNIEIEIGVEKERLSRYLEMYNNADAVSDQIDLNDRIFTQERRIKYLEDSLRNINNRIDYSSISFSMNEERSEWINIAFVKLSSLIRNFIESLNGLLSFIFGVIPWAVALFAGWYVWKRFRRK